MPAVVTVRCQPKSREISLTKTPNTQLATTPDPPAHPRAPASTVHQRFTGFLNIRLIALTLSIRPLCQQPGCSSPLRVQLLLVPQGVSVFQAYPVRIPEVDGPHEIMIQWSIDPHADFLQSCPRFHQSGLVLHPQREVVGELWRLRIEDRSCRVTEIKERQVITIPHLEKEVYERQAIAGRCQCVLFLQHGHQRQTKTFLVKLACFRRVAALVREMVNAQSPDCLRLPFHGLPLLQVRCINCDVHSLL